MYLYETHCHTFEVSRCSRVPAKDLVDFYKSIGYSGIFITDHFFNGNCKTHDVDPEGKMSWEEMVNFFAQGYEAAKKRGDEIGLKVFFGIEFTVGGCDFTAYGVSPEWLLKYPHCEEMYIGDIIDAVHEAGGMVFQAHAFREAAYIKLMRLIPWKVDGFEIFNAERPDFENNIAKVFTELYSEKRRLIRYAGSDNHVGRRPRLAAVALEKEIGTPAEYIAEVLAERHKLLKLTQTEDGYLREELV